MRNKEKVNFADKDIQVVLGTLLRVGVILSMTVVFIGGILYLWTNSNQRIHYSIFHPGAGNFSSMLQIWSGVKALDGAAIIQAGTLLLIFTPITRVVFSIFSFLIERDYLYVLIGMFVLSVILFSLSNKLVG
jgi:uncharacterized membrane protein